MQSDRQNEIQKALNQPFDESQVKWKPQITKKKDGSGYYHGNQQVAGCTAHIDARDVMNRLDEVVGTFGWSDSYHVLGDKNVECMLTVNGVTKSDVGEVNPDGFADPLKTAYSDALKRAAVKFGIGRHLYDMEIEWLPYDGYKILEQSPKLRQNKATPPQPQRQQDYPGATIEEQVAEFKDNGKPTSNKIADVWLWVEEKFVNDSINLGILADGLIMTGEYKAREHVANWLNGKECKSLRDAGLVVDFRRKVSRKGAGEIWNMAIERKAEDGDNGKKIS